jgi:chromosome segregation ATPase
MTSQEAKKSLIDANNGVDIAGQDKLALNKNTLDKVEEAYAEFIEETKKSYLFNEFKDHARTIYDSLHLTLKNESAQFAKILHLKRENKELTLKYEQAIKLANVDQRAKQDLIKDLEKAWYQANLAKSKEKGTLETIKSLKLEISNLSKLVEQGVGLTMGQEYNVREILKEKDALAIENRQLVEEMAEMKDKMTQLETKEAECDRKVEEIKVEMNHAIQEALACKLEIQRLTRKNERLDEEILQQKRIYENKELNLVRLNQSIEPLRVEKARLEASLRDTLLSLEKTRKEVEILNAKQGKLQNENDQLFLRNDAIQIENGLLMQQVKRGQELIELHKTENANAQKMRDSFERKLKMLELERNNLIAEKQTLGLQLESSEKKRDELNSKVDRNSKQIESLVSDKDLLNGELKKSQAETEKQLGMLKALKIEMNNLKNENLKLRKSGEKTSNLTSNHEKEKTKLDERINELLAKLNRTSHALRMKCMHFAALEKELAANQAKLCDLKCLYELAKNEKENLKNNCNSLTEEIHTLKDKLTSIENVENSSAKLLKQKIDSLESLSKMASLYKKKMTALNLKAEANQILISDLRSKLDFFEKKEQKLLEEIKSLNSNLKTIEKDRVIMEMSRNVFGTQLVRRNDEIALLYEKIDLLEGFLERGHQVYNVCSSKLKKTEFNLSVTKNENYKFKSERKATNETRQALALSEKELIIEKAKRNALESENSQTVNVHRWRKLSICDPNTHELISKINLLQKRLIFKSEQVACLHMKFLEKDRVFIELKRVLARRLVDEDSINEIEDRKKIANRTIRKNKVTYHELFCVKNNINKIFLCSKRHF